MSEVSKFINYFISEYNRRIKNPFSVEFLNRVSSRFSEQIKSSSFDAIELYKMIEDESLIYDCKSNNSNVNLIKENKILDCDLKPNFLNALIMIERLDEIFSENLDHMRKKSISNKDFLNELKIQESIYKSKIQKLRDNSKIYINNIYEDIHNEKTFYDYVDKIRVKYTQEDIHEPEKPYLNFIRFIVLIVISYIKILFDKIVVRI